MKSKSTKVWIVVFLLPTIVLFLGFYAYSIITVFVTGFTDWKLGEPISFVGISNFTKMFQDITFQVSLKNTLIWLVLHWIILVGISLLVALVTIKKTRFSRITRVIYLIPKMIPLAVIGFLYYFMFNPSIGLVNDFIRKLGFENFNVNWFQDTRTAFAAVTVTTIFYGGVFMLLISSEIAAIPAEVYESAKVDGASEFQINTMIVLPLIKNIVGTCLILATVDCLKTFEVIYLTTSGGPGELTMNLPVLIFRTAMTNSNYGYANAIAIVTILIGALSMLLITKVFRIGKD